MTKPDAAKDPPAHLPSSPDYGALRAYIKHLHAKRSPEGRRMGVEEARGQLAGAAISAEDRAIAEATLEAEEEAARG